MRNPLSILRNLKRLVPSGFNRRSAHREIAVIGPREDCCRQLAEVLFSGRGSDDGARAGNRTRAVARAVSPAASESGPEGATYRGLFLPPGGRRRNRWWNARVPDRINAPDAPEDGDWQMESDTFLICLPFDHLSGEGLRRDDLDFHLPLAVGRARSRGRLRRAAVVVSDIPGEFGPHHVSQVRCDVPWKRDIASGVRARVDAASGRPGDGLADPLWSSFLLKYVSENAGFAELYEVIRRAAGRNCPVFFVPAEAERIDAQVPLLEWIHGARPGRNRSRGRFAAALGTVAAGLILAVLGLAWNVPPSLSEERTQELLTALVNSPSDPQLREELEELVNHYPNRPARALGLSDDRLQEALKAIRFYEGQGNLLRLPPRRARALREELGRIVVGEPGDDVDTADGDPSASLAKLRETLQEDLALRRAWLIQAADRGIDPSATRGWDERLAELAVLYALLTLRIEGEGLGRVRGSEETLQEATQALYDVGSSEISRQLETLFVESAPIGFYQRYAELLATGAASDAFERFAARLPRPDAGKIISDLRQLSLSEIAARRRSVERQLAAVIELGEFRLGAESQDAPLVNADTLQAARELDERIDAAFRPREMIVSFLRMQGARWHLDIRVGDEPFEPTSAPGEDYASVFPLPRGRFGQRLELVVNLNNDVHVAPPDSVCTDNAPTTIVLDRREGSVLIDGHLVHFEVISGWPEWESTEDEGEMR